MCGKESEFYVHSILTYSFNLNKILICSKAKFVYNPDNVNKIFGSIQIHNNLFKKNTNFVLQRK